MKSIAYRDICKRNSFEKYRHCLVEEQNE